HPWNRGYRSAAVAERSVRLEWRGYADRARHGAGSQCTPDKTIPGARSGPPLPSRKGRLPKARTVRARHERALALARHGLFLFSSRKKIVSHDVKQGRDSVSPRDLFAFEIGPARVTYRHFEDPGVGVREPRSYLRLKAEALRSERQRARHLATNSFVAALHVREVQVAEHVA